MSFQKDLWRSASESNGWQHSGNRSGQASTADRSQLNRNRQARDRGTTRTRNYRSSGAARSRAGAAKLATGHWPLAPDVAICNAMGWALLEPRFPPSYLCRTQFS